MLRRILLAAGVSLVLASAGSAAPLISPDLQLKQVAASDLVQVKKKYKGKKYHGKNWYKNNWNHRRHYRGRYWYGGRSWGRRYYSRPYYWRSWGCVAVGPVWYCP